MSWRKYKKVQTFFCSNRKRSYRNQQRCNESFVTISYKIKFIDIARFMATSLSNLVDDLPEGIHKIKCKDCDCFPEYESVKDN